MIVNLLRKFWNTLFVDNKGTRQWELSSFLVLATWAATVGLLIVSIPHSIKVLRDADKGHEEITATALAIIVELVPALLLLIALHAHGLEKSLRYWIGGMSIPFVLLVVHIQYVYYAGETNAQIAAWEPSLILPYGIVCFAIAMAIILNSQKREKTAVEMLTEETNGIIVGLQKQIAQLETSLVTEREKVELLALPVTTSVVVVYPDETIDATFKRMNPKAGNLKQVDAKAIIREAIAKAVQEAGGEIK